MFSLDRKSVNSNRNGNSEPKMDKSSYDGAELKNKVSNFRVLDLSDNNFRQTFIGSVVSDKDKQG